MDIDAKRSAEADVLKILLEFLQAKAEGGSSIDDVITMVKKAIERKKS